MQRRRRAVKMTRRSNMGHTHYSCTITALPEIPHYSINTIMWKIVHRISTG